jgi:hypothetical protein
MSSPDPDWDDRLAYWRRRLGRIRLGVEPVEDQLARYRRVTWMLTAVATLLALIFIALFSAFRRPDVGAWLALVLFGPVVAIAWVDHGLLTWRVGRYMKEARAHEQTLL